MPANRGAVGCGVLLHVVQSTRLCMGLAAVGGKGAELCN